MRRGRGHGPADGDGGNVPGALELEHQGVVEGGAGDGGEAEAGLGGVLEVGAAVGEVDEGHSCGGGFWCGGWDGGRRGGEVARVGWLRMSRRWRALVFCDYDDAEGQGSSTWVAILQLWRREVDGNSRNRSRCGG